MFNKILFLSKCKKHTTMVANPFITQEDIDKFQDFNNDFPRFCLELHRYLTVRWVGKNYQNDDKLNENQLKSKNDISPLLNYDIEEFNRNIKFPSFAAECEFDSAFTGIFEDDYEMTNTSKEYLGYFYHIYLHMD